MLIDLIGICPLKNILYWKYMRGRLKLEDEKLSVSFERDLNRLDELRSLLIAGESFSSLTN